MHLSKVLLLPGRLDNAWEWHRAIWTLFPSIERQPNESAPFLFRVDRVNLAKGAELLVQSSIPPEHESSRAKLLASREFNPQPRDGQSLAFRLTANVTKAIRDENDHNRKIRVPLIKEDQQRAWLKRKLGDAGNSLTNVSVQQHPPIYFRKGNRPGKIVAVSFQGNMIVGNSERLSNLLKGAKEHPPGIGPAKAFGCGLLLVRRV